MTHKKFIHIISMLLALTVFVGFGEIRGGESPIPTITLKKSTVAPREPVMVELTFHNKTDRPLVIEGPNVGIIRVKPKDGLVTTYHLFENSMDSSGYDVEIPPGETDVVIQWVVLGENRSGDSKLSFIFEIPGKYEVSFPEYGGKSVELTVSSTLKRKDIEAFTNVAAKSLLGERQWRVTEAGIRDMKKVIQDNEKSPYVPYFVWYMAKWTVYGDSERAVEWKDAVRLLDIVIQKHADHFLVEECIYFKIRCLLWVEKGEEVAIESLALLKKKFPESKFPARLKKDHDFDENGRPPPIEPVVPKNNLPAKLKIEGIVKVPKELRGTLEGYWSAISKGEFDGAAKYLSKDFEGPNGDKQNWRRSWDLTWKTTNFESLTLNIDSVRKTDSYSRPSILPKDARRWEGSLFVVNYREDFQFIDIWSGEKSSDFCPKFTITLLLMENKWKVVSIYSKPSPNNVLSTLVFDLKVRLMESLSPTIPLAGANPSLRSLVVKEFKMTPTKRKLISNRVSLKWIDMKKNIMLLERTIHYQDDDDEGPSLGTVSMTFTLDEKQKLKCESIKFKKVGDKVAEDAKGEKKK